MPCTICGATDHETSAHPKPEADKVDKLIDAMSRMMDRPAPVSEPTHEQAAPTKSGPTEEEVAATFQDLVNRGQGGEAYQYISNQVISPRMQAMMVPVLTSLGDANIERLRTKYGMRFAKREPLFQAKMRELGIRQADLASMKTAEDVWTLVRGSDPTYEKEVVDEQLSASRKQWEEEQRASAALPLGPSPTPWRGKPESKDTADKLLPKDPEVREYLERQLDAYNVEPDKYLEEIRKSEDPEASTRVGVGPFAKKIWTIIGPVNDPSIRRLKRGRE